MATPALAGALGSITDPVSTFFDLPSPSQQTRLDLDLVLAAVRCERCLMRPAGRLYRCLIDGQK